MSATETVKVTLNNGSAIHVLTEELRNAGWIPEDDVPSEPLERFEILELRVNSELGDWLPGAVQKQLQKMHLAENVAAQIVTRLIGTEAAEREIKRQLERTFGPQAVAKVTVGPSTIDEEGVLLDSKILTSVGEGLTPRYEFYEGTRIEHDNIRVLWRRLGRGAQAPSRAIGDDTGYDLTTAHEVVIPANSFADVKTNVAIQPPPGYWSRIVGRSSSLRKHSIMVNEGIIDEGYRGELFVGVWNLKGSPATLAAGTRIAQLIFHKRINAVFDEVDVLDDSKRGDAGFGSTGE